jgi:hypothetical protein
MNSVLFDLFIFCSLFEAIIEFFLKKETSKLLLCATGEERE